MPSLRTMPTLPAGGRRRLNAPGAPTAAGTTLRNFIVAEARRFHDGRGEFDEASLRAVINLWPANGLKSRWCHPNESGDSLGQFLGRARNPRLSKTADGTPCVKADLALDPTAFKIPVEGGALSRGDYVLSLARREPDALGASLVLNKSEWQRKDEKGRPALDDEGEPLPAIWTPTRLYAVDLVGEGAATSSILSPSRYAYGLVACASQALDGLADDEVRPTVEGWLRALASGRHEGIPLDLLTTGRKVFVTATTGTIQKRVEAFLQRYLDRRERAGTRSTRELRKQLEAKAGGATRDPKKLRVLLEKKVARGRRS